MRAEETNDLLLLLQKGSSAKNDPDPEIGLACCGLAVVVKTAEGFVLVSPGSADRCRTYHIGRRVNVDSELYDIPAPFFFPLLWGDPANVHDEGAKGTRTRPVEQEISEFAPSRVQTRRV